MSTRSLRYYEQQEMLLADRTDGGQRVYDESAVERVGLIRLLFAAGVPSSGVVELLPCIYSGTTTPAMIQRLEQERDRLLAEQDRLHRTLDRMGGLLDEARHRLAGPDAPAQRPASAGRAG